MNYEEMIQTECTDARYDAWAEYREKVTDFILDSVLHFYRREKLKKEGLRRISGEYGLEQACRELGRQPVLAIWGAGGCNDIDLQRLSKYFRLVLIDRGYEQSERSRARFGLSAEQCLCADLRFWDIPHDAYRMLVALLKDNAPDEVVMEYIDEVIAHMDAPDYETLPRFDFSVCIGLASQLNARLGMLLTLHERNGRLKEYVRRLNKRAVGRLMKVMDTMTSYGFIYGYELAGRMEDSSEQSGQKSPADLFAEQVNMINIMHEEWAADGAWPPHGYTSSVAGNEYLSAYIGEAVNRGMLAVRQYKALIWNFTERKRFLMLFGAFERFFCKL